MNKKILYTLFVLLVFIGCSADETLVNKMDKCLNVAVQTNGMADSRAIINSSYLDSNSSIGVTVIDEVTLTDYDNIPYYNVKYTAKGEGTEQIWIGSKNLGLVEYDAKAVAYYPYNEDAADYTAIPVEAGTTDYMYSGWVTGLNNNNTDARFTMKHALSALHITIKKDSNIEEGKIISSIKIKSAFLGTSAKLNAGTGEFSDISGVNSWYNNSVSDVLTSEGVVYEYMMIPNETLNENIIMVVFTIDGRDYSKLVVLDDKVGQGEMIKCTFSLSVDELSLNEVEVIPWLIKEKEDTCLDVFSSYLVLQYDVTTTESNTNLIYSTFLSDVDEMIIDGASTTPVSSFKFNTIGEHEVKIKFKDETKLPSVKSSSSSSGLFYNCSNLSSVLMFPTLLEEIGSYSFYNSNIRSISSFPPKLNCIRKYAFDNCKVLTGEIKIPESVTSIEEYAFAICKELTGVKIPNSITSIGEYVFLGCDGLKEITVPNSVTTIGKSAFSGCDGLTILDLGTGVQTIGSCAFEGCTGLTGTLYIPNSVQTIGGAAFEGCYAITSLQLGTGVQSIGGYAFENCTGLKSLELGTNIQSIGNFAFSGCTGLTEVTIPNSVTSIGDRAFAGCSGIINFSVDYQNTLYDSRNNCNAIVETASNTLVHGCKNTVIPISVTSIGENAFYKCSGLAAITIPNSVKSIGGSAFMYCSGLTEVVIGSEVQSIGIYAFHGCTELTEVTIPNSVKTIGSYAFENCKKLTAVTIPNSVTSIGDYAFRECWTLASLEIGTGVQSIGGYAFENCNRLTNVTIPNSVTFIGGGAFYQCTGLTAVDLGTGVKSIGGSTFKNCWNLKEINFPEAIETIGNSAFYGCERLTEIVIPNSVTSIGEYAFQGCKGLTSITSMAMTAATINKYTFYLIKTGGILYVPVGATGYDTWMQTGDYYLGKYQWTIQNL